MRQVALFVVNIFMKNAVFCEETFDKNHALLYVLIICLALRVGKVNQILRCDWLSERARWSSLAGPGLPAAVVSCKTNFPESYIS